MNGHYFNYRVPLLETYLGNTIMKLLNEPVTESEIAKLRPEADVDRLERFALEEAKIKEEEEKVAKYTPAQKRRYTREQRDKVRIDEDQASERLLKAEMEKTRAKVSGKALVFERLRGLVTLENDLD